MGSMLAALALPALLAAAGTPAIDGTWRSTEVPGFVVYGDVDERTLDEVAHRLATLRAVLSTSAAGLDMGAERPIPVYAFRSSKAFAPYRPGGGRGTKPLGGYFAMAFGYRAIALDLSTEGGYEAVYHELTHHIVRRNFGSVPLWFSEGTAVLYETFQKGSTSATIGWVPRSRLEWFGTHALMPTKALARVTDETPEYNEAERAGTFYLQSWLLVHDLLFGNASRGPQLAKYLGLVHDGAPADAALDAAFEGGAAALDAELKDYLARGEFKYTTMTFEQLRVPAASRPRELDRVEALDALGVLALVASPRNPDFAASHFRAALEIAPGHPRARAGLAAAAIADHRFVDALPDAKAALSAGVDDPALLVLAARAVLRIESDKTGGSVDLDAAPSADILEAREWLKRAIKADPFDDEPLIAYGESFVVAGGDASSGIAAFERAEAIDPLDEASAFNLLELYVRRRDRAKAEALFDKRLQPKAKAAVLRDASESLLRLDVEDARDAMAAEDHARALDLMRGVRDRTTQDATRANAAEVIADLEAAIAAAPKKKPAATAAPKPARKP